MPSQPRKINRTQKSIGAAFAILAIAGVAVWLYSRPADVVTTSQTRHYSDFPAGSEVVYAAKFTQWPIRSDSFGASELNANGTYLLKPTGNTWFSGGPPVSVPPLEHDFVITVGFRIPQGDPSIEVKIFGESTPSEALALSLHRNGSDLSYHLEKGVQEATHFGSPTVIVEQGFVPGSHDWSTPGKLTLKRTGDAMELFVGDQFLREFPASKAIYATLMISAAQKGMVELTSLEVRTPTS